MAYNTSKGKRDLGDIEFEGDPDTQIDFGQNTIKLRTNGKIQFGVFGSKLFCSSSLTSSNGLKVYNSAQAATKLAVNKNGALSSSLHVSASAFRGLAERVTFPIKTVTANYSVTKWDYTVLADTSTANITVTIPAASTVSGKIYNVKKISGLNAVTITSSAGSTIDSATSKIVTTNNESISIHSNGAYWFII